MNKPNIFEDDFDDADHIHEIAPRSVASQARKRHWENTREALQILAGRLSPPIVPNLQQVRKPDHYEFTPTGRIVDRDKEFTRMVGVAQEQLHSILARPIAKVAKCSHEWPEAERGTDLNGSCTKCGMSFMLYIHTECP